MKDKAHGGPFDTPFAHADEAEASYSLALFPEFMDPKLFVDNKPAGFLPPGHTDKGGDVYHAPIKGHEHVGLGGIEVKDYPEGVIGSPTKASADKAMAGSERSHGLHVQAGRRHHDQIPGGRSASSGPGHHAQQGRGRRIHQGTAERRQVHLHPRLSALR